LYCAETGEERGGDDTPHREGHREPSTKRPGHSLPIRRVPRYADDALREKPQKTHDRYVEEDQ
jgi:hypothetical protein